jgi:hypothetical protein
MGTTIKSNSMYKLIFVLILLFSFCKGSDHEKKTPREFRSAVYPGDDIYQKDSAALVQILYEQLKNHKQAFTNSEYFESTIIIVDSILYDSSLNRIGVFVIAKNPTYRNEHSDSKQPFYFNASCYLGKRLFADSSVFKIIQLGPFSLSNFHNINQIKEAIRYSYFLELSTVQDADGKPFFDYNLDDKRFWDSETGWDAIKWDSIK